MKQTLLSFLFALLPIVTSADVVEIDGIYYNLRNKRADVTINAQCSGEIVIPESVSYEGITYTVKNIEGMAFKGCREITSISIPKSVTSIGTNAFMDCISLSSVKISDLPAWCSTYISGTYSNPLQYAKHLFLNDEEIKELIIPDGITEIKSYSFYGFAGLTSVKIPNSVTTIGDHAFEGCTGLTLLSIPNSVTSIGSKAFSDCCNLTSLSLPNEIESKDFYAFDGCSSLTSINIPNGVSYFTLMGCSSLETVTIPQSVTEIWASSFEGCNSLSSIVVDKDNQYYDSREDCNAIIETSTNTLIIGGNKTIIPKSVTLIGVDAFKGRKGLTSIYIPCNVTLLYSNSFEGCI